MTLTPPAARRLLLLGCALIGAAALALPGCGDSGAATAEAPLASPPKQGVEARATARKPCPPPVNAFVKSLDALRSQLAVGLSYAQYTAKVKALRESYAQLPVERLALDCLIGAGTASEKAINKYIDAANAWGECLADASCDTATIEPVLQRKWRIASRFLSEAQ